MSFFTELRRRNVFRVAIAYILLGWAVLQGADFMLDLVSAPEWVIRVFVIAGAVGLLLGCRSALHPWPTCSGNGTWCTIRRIRSGPIAIALCFLTVMAQCCFIRCSIFAGMMLLSMI